GIELTSSILEMVGARALLGRILEARDAAVGANRVVVLSYRTWEQYFGRDPHIVGQTVPFDGRGYRVVGVMGSAFEFPDRQTHFWTPLVWPRRARLPATARLRDGV